MVLLSGAFLSWGLPVELWLVIGKMLRGHKHNVVIILKMLQIITTLWFHLIPKPYSDYGYIIREYHFHFLGLGISGWGIWFFYGGAGPWV